MIIRLRGGGGGDKHWLDFYGWFSPDIIAKISVHSTIDKEISWEFDSIIIQNASHKLLLFFALTWPSYHMMESR